MAGKATTPKRVPIVTKTSKTANLESTFDNSVLSSIATGVNETLKKNFKDLETSPFQIGTQPGEELQVNYWIKTGIPSLDYAIGGVNHPGVPGGRIVEIFGGEATGKSTLCVHLVKRSIDALDSFAIYQDAEQVLTEEIIQGSGIDMDRVIHQNPQILEEAFTSQQAAIDLMLERDAKLKNKTKPFVIVLDSVAACSTKSELEGEYGDATMGIHARLMSQALRKIKGPIAKLDIMSLFINQTRSKIGNSWGKQYSTFGGEALKFYASVRILLTKIETLKKNEVPVGARIRASIEKNKVAPPLKKAEYNIMFREGTNGSYPEIDTAAAVLDWCLEKELGEDVLKPGSAGRVEYKGKSYYRLALINEMYEDPTLYAELEDLAYSYKG